MRNAGRLTANNVRIGHNFLPESFQLYPPVAHSVEQIPNGGADILIPTLVPGERVTISYLYYPPVFWNHINSYAKSDEGLAQRVGPILDKQQLVPGTIAGKDGSVRVDGNPSMEFRVQELLRFGSDQAESF